MTEADLHAWWERRFSELTDGPSVEIVARTMLAVAASRLVGVFGLRYAALLLGMLRAELVAEIAAPEQEDHTKGSPAETVH